MAIENQAQRMEYPSYTCRGLQIGSGSAESAVKQVVGTRLNQAGVRWNPERAEAVAHVCSGCDSQPPLGRFLV